MQFEIIRYNGKGEQVDETYQPIIPPLIELLEEVAARRQQKIEELEKVKR